MKLLSNFMGYFSSGGGGGKEGGFGIISGIGDNSDCSIIWRKKKTIYTKKIKENTLKTM